MRGERRKPYVSPHWVTDAWSDITDDRVVRVVVDAAGGDNAPEEVVRGALDAVGPQLHAVLVGDDELFIEVTGSDYPSVALTASILACDLSDFGFAIENVEVRYPYDTPFGRNVVFPAYFQQSMEIGRASCRERV